MTDSSSINDRETSNTTEQTSKQERPFWHHRHVNVRIKKGRPWLYSKDGTRFQPDQDYLDKSLLLVSADDEYLPLVIGVLSLVLATLVAVLDATYGATCARDSISHYFYAPIAGSAFIIILGFIAAFMFAYRGQSVWDGRITTFGALGAIGTAAFPTTGLGCLDGQLFDVKLIQNTAIVFADGNLHAVKMPENTSIGGRIVGMFTETVRIFDNANAAAENDIAQSTTYTIANTLSQKAHQTSAIVLIGSLILLSVRHMCRHSWLIFNARADKYIKRKVSAWETAFTFIAVVFMLIGAVMASGLFPAFGVFASGIIAEFGVIGYSLSGKNFSEEIRPVFHGELLALVAFGFAWAIQWISYKWFVKGKAVKKVADAIQERRRLVDEMEDQPESQRL